MRGKLCWLLVLLLGCLGVNAQPCVPGSDTLCLNEGRFAVRVDWADVSGNPRTLADITQAGSGTGRTQSDDSGLFWFFSEDNWEMLVKVLDGCAINDRFWVFAAATTNVEYTLTVTDTETAQVRTYFNPILGNPPAVTDTNAFSTCATATTTTPAPVSPPLPISFDPTEAGTCVADAGTLCLFSNRFAVQVNWRDFSGATGGGGPIPVTNQSGLFSFFTPNSFELLINIYDGRPRNGRFWVFAAATTDVEYEIVVTDTLTSEVRTYSKPLGVAPVATLDIGQTGPTGSAPRSVPLFGSYGVALLLMAMLWLAARRLRWR